MGKLQQVSLALANACKVASAYIDQEDTDKAGIVAEGEAAEDFVP